MAIATSLAKLKVILFLLRAISDGAARPRHVHVMLLFIVVVPDLCV